MINASFKHIYTNKNNKNTLIARPAPPQYSIRHKPQNDSPRWAEEVVHMFF